jgi:uncharacterized protein YdgA (DUF945 family)
MDNKTGVYEEKEVRRRLINVSKVFSSKKILVMIGVVVVFALAVPVIVGHYAEKEVRAAFARLSTQYPMYKFRIVRYDKGLFTSKAQVEVVVEMPQTSQETQAYQKIKLPATMLIGHGPITFQSDEGLWHVQLALASGHLSFSVSEYADQFLEEPLEEHESVTGGILDQVIGPIAPMVKFVVVFAGDKIRSQAPETFGKIGEQLRASGEDLFIAALRQYPPIKMSFTRNFEGLLSIGVYAAPFDISVQKEGIFETGVRRVHWEGLRVLGTWNLADSTSELEGKIAPFHLEANDGRLLINSIYFKSSSRRLFQPIALGDTTIRVDEMRFAWPDGQSIHMQGLEGRQVVKEVEGVLRVFYEYKLDALRQTDPRGNHTDYSGTVGFTITGLDDQTAQETMARYVKMLHEPHNAQLADSFQQSLLTFLTYSAQHKPHFAIEPLQITFGKQSLNGKIEASLDASQDVLSYFFVLDLAGLSPSQPIMGFQDCHGVLHLTFTGLDRQATQDVMRQFLKVLTAPENELLLAQFEQSFSAFLTTSVQHHPSVVMEPLRISFGEESIVGRVKVSLEDSDAQALYDAASFLSSLEGEAHLTAPRSLAIKLLAAKIEQQLAQMKEAGLLEMDAAETAAVAKNRASETLQQIQAGGWLTVDGNALTTTALLKGGKLLINGQELPLPLP